MTLTTSHSFFNTFNNFFHLFFNTVLSSVSLYNSTGVTASNDFYNRLPDSKDIIWLSSYLTLGNICNSLTFCSFLKFSSVSYQALWICLQLCRIFICCLNLFFSNYTCWSSSKYSLDFLSCLLTILYLGNDSIPIALNNSYMLVTYNFSSLMKTSLERGKFI